MYTNMYNVEAEIFAGSPLPQALMALGFITLEDATKIGEDLGDWIGSLSSQWSEWLGLCVLSVALAATECDVKPKRTSIVQQVGSTYGPTDKIAVRNALRRIRANANTSNPKQVELALDPALKAALADPTVRKRLVNGKHLAAYLTNQVRAHPIAKLNRIGRFENLAIPVFLRGLDYGADWAAPFRRQIHRLAS
jgi:hypothetical protein